MPTDRDPVRVLVVEDEPALAAVIGDYLHADGYEVTVVADGFLAVERARVSAPQVVVLDLGLPGLDGLEVCRRLREFSAAYVIMLTARAEEEDVLRGLSGGADDYLTKPFRPKELLARVRVLLRRARTPGPLVPTVRTVGALTIDLPGRRADLAGTPVDLTPTEFDLLACLVASPGVALSRRALIEALRGEDWFGDDNLVDVHVLNLRRKLGDDAATGRYVCTVRGVGYRLGDG